MKNFHLLGFRNGTILAILNQVSAQLDIRFGRRCLLKNFKMATNPWWPSWISEGMILACESLCHFDASHQVLAQFNLQLGRCCLKNFKMGAVATLLDIGTEQF